MTGTGQQTAETNRLEAFSDGVFAIAITLLALDVRVPNAADAAARGGLGSALVAQWPNYIAYFTSFLTILIMWVNHHRLLRNVGRADHAFLMLNGLLLMFVTLVPFPTALLAEYVRTDDARTAALVYSGAFVLIAVCFRSLWFYAAKSGRLLHDGHDPAQAAHISRQYRFGPLFYVGAFALAFLSVWASVAACALLAVFFALPGRRHPQ